MGQPINEGKTNENGILASLIALVMSGLPGTEERPKLTHEPTGALVKIKTIRQVEIDIDHQGFLLTSAIVDCFTPGGLPYWLDLSRRGESLLTAVSRNQFKLESLNLYHDMYLMQTPIAPD